jgi:hypothetical protein
VRVMERGYKKACDKGKIFRALRLLHNCPYLHLYTHTHTHTHTHTCTHTHTHTHTHARTYAHTRTYTHTHTHTQSPQVVQRAGPCASEVGQRERPQVSCLLSAVCCLLSAVCCLLSAVCCLLSAVCCLLFACIWYPSTPLCCAGYKRSKSRRRWSRTRTRQKS